ncbi:glycosyltransferase family 9 protein [Dyella ginsengisoli]|uniref:glycosyltransferase family 9 protein n=1 Tax=Dyella ginsengisoli TaxID=363848 RepID=UPI00036812A2|nr:glycosyltransferase family 9 protein [Dyella ginsengisoli]
MPSARPPVVIRFARLGDTVLLQPLLRLLHRRHREPCVLLALGECAHGLYDGHPDVGRVIALRTQSGPLWLHPERLRAVGVLRALRDSPFYVCQNEPRFSTKVLPMLRRAGIPREHCSFIGEMPTVAGEHEIDWLLRFGDRLPPAFLDAAGAGVVEDVPRAPELPLADGDRIECLDWLGRRGWLGRPLVLLQPSNKRTMRWNGVRDAADDDKAWPAERWGALARAIAAQLPGARIVLCGAPAERRHVESIRAAAGCPQLVSACGELPLPRMKALLELAHSMVSVDTGPAHLAAAMGCPLVVMFGARWPSQWTPRSGKGSPVTVLGGLPDVLRVDALSIESVFSAWTSLAWQLAASAPLVTSAPTGASSIAEWLREIPGAPSSKRRSPPGTRQEP